MINARHSERWENVESEQAIFNLAKTNFVTNFFGGGEKFNFFHLFFPFYLPKNDKKKESTLVKLFLTSNKGTLASYLLS